MIIQLNKIAYARSGDKGQNSNIGIIFENNKLYKWALNNITEKMIKKHFKNIAKGNVIRYKLDNINALNFILEDSLGGGGSESLLNDAQGKTYAQTLLQLKVDIPNELL